jgi:fructose-bisphosphate aldolase class II
MPLVDMHDMLKHAHRNHYAVSGFGVTHLNFIEAVLAAAERCRSPVVLKLADSGACNDFELLAAAAERAAQRATVPVALHFNQAATPEAATRAINLGCNSIAAEAVPDSFPATVSHARSLTELAHGCGVAVEGQLQRFDDNAGELPLTAVEEAKAFVQRTHVDYLAVSICVGNVRTRARIKFDIERLRRIQDAVKIPLVIHATTGPTDEQCHKFIQHGVARVDYSSLLTELAAEKLRVGLRQNSHGSYAELMQGVSTALEGEVEHCLQRCCSAGRAAEVLVQCHRWRPVEHLIIYNVEGAEDPQVETMMERGREVLARIPGVRSVFTGQSIPDGARFRYCWLVKFAHEKVIDSYRQHFQHVAFANQLFRPIAGDRISIDFVESGHNMEFQVPSGMKRFRA